MTETGTLLVPRRAEGPGGLVGDGMVEIGPDDPEYAEWAAEVARQSQQPQEPRPAPPDPA
jgi:hypothetical protein